MEGNGVLRSKVEVGQVKSSCNEKGKEKSKLIVVICNTRKVAFSCLVKGW